VNMSSKDLKNALSYIQSELNRIETMAGTLAVVEREHYNKLTNFDNRELTDIAVEEQSASRQLGTIKQMCLTLSQKVEDISNTMGVAPTQGSAEHGKAD